MEFVVSETPELAGEAWSIVGRCSTAIVHGHRFTKCTPYQTHRNMNNELVTSYGESFDVDLCIEKILAYKYELDVLDTGMTALLIVTGDASSVRENTVLRDGERSGHPLFRSHENENGTPTIGWKPEN